MTPRKLVLSLSDVSIQIPVYGPETRSLKKSLINSVTGGHLRRNANSIAINALQHLTCSFFEGERVALIGHNGSGKSTFLKLIAGIYMPTSGRIDKYIRVFPMIQKSFITSPELSGYQAIKAHYLMVNGNLSGFNAFCQGVIEFSGLGDFVDLPIKTYSEGMSARLLFSILTAFRHECLAMDEGFGAGDLHFYDKAQERMQEFIDDTGTLFLASHSTELLHRFCRRALVFQKGSIVFDGFLDDALKVYHSL